MIKENTLTVKAISEKFSEHVNNYITENMDQKRKMFLLIVFKVFFKSKWKRRKLKSNRRPAFVLIS